MAKLHQSSHHIVVFILTHKVLGISVVLDALVASHRLLSVLSSFEVRHGCLFNRIV